MPGHSSDSRFLWFVGVVVITVAVVGTQFLGWEFGQTDETVPLALAVVCGMLAVINWVR